MPSDDSSQGKVLEFESDARRRAKKALVPVVETTLAAADDETVTDAELEEVEDARRFKRRYGFRWPLADRQRLLFFQMDRGLVDSEIRILQASGNLHRRPDGLVLASRRWLAWLGWVQIVILAVMFGPLVTLGLFVYGGRMGLLQWLGVSLVVLSVSCVAIAYYFQCVKPWRIKQRAERSRATAARTEGEGV